VEGVLCWRIKLVIVLDEYAICPSVCGAGPFNGVPFDSRLTIDTTS